MQRLLNGHIQRDAASAKGGELESGLSDEIQHARTGGAPLDGNAGSQIASALGANFSGVTVHTDARADALNRAVSAKAFTTGSDIFFSKGAYAPSTHSGKQLLAHELTHVIQQNPARVNRMPAEIASPHPVQRMVWRKPNKIQTKLTVGPAGDRFEQEADAVAAQVMRGSLQRGAARPGKNTRSNIHRAPATIQRKGFFTGSLEDKVDVHASSIPQMLRSIEHTEQIVSGLLDATGISQKIARDQSQRVQNRVIDLGGMKFKKKKDSGPSYNNPFTKNLETRTDELTKQFGSLNERARKTNLSINELRETPQFKGLTKKINQAKPSGEKDVRTIDLSDLGEMAKKEKEDTGNVITRTVHKKVTDQAKALEQLNELVRTNMLSAEEMHSYYAKLQELVEESDKGEKGGKGEGQMPPVPDRNKRPLLPRTAGGRGLPKPPVPSSEGRPALSSEQPPEQPSVADTPPVVKTELKDDTPKVIPGVGMIKKPKVSRSDSVHWYQWSREDGFTQTARKAKKGTTLNEARPTTDPKFAWAVTPDFKAGGYLHTSNLTVTHWGATKTPYHVDKNRLLETVDGTKPGNPYKDTNSEWYIDQAVLMESWRTLKAKEQQREVMQDPEKQKQLALTQKQLALAMLNAFAKAAPVEQQVIGDPLGVQTSPLQGQAIYHRSAGGNPLLDQLRGLIAQDIKLPMESLQVLSDPLFMEVMAREFPVYGSKGPSEGRVKVNTEIDSLPTFEASVDAILANYGAGHAPSGTFVLNVTGFYQSLGCLPNELTAKVSRPLEGVLIRKTQAYIAGKPGQDSQALVTSILHHIQVVALTKVKGIDVLLVPKLFKPMSETEQKTFSEDENKLHKKVDEDTRNVFMQPGSHDDQKLDSAMIESGARLDPAAARAAMLEFASPEKLIGNLAMTKLTTSHLKTPTVAKDINAFLATATFTKFRALSTEKDAPPYQTMYPAATADLLAGLAKVSTKEGKLDEIFQKKQITDVLQHAYYRMLNAMAGASTFKGDLIQFMNNIEIIHDQLQMLLGIAQPHSQDIDFSNSIKRQLQTAKDGKTTVPLEFDPKVHHKASAMHSVSSILSGVESEKEQRAGTRALNALVLKDNYYEAHGAVLHNAKTYNVDELDGWTLKDDKGLDIDLVDKSFASGAKPKGKIDIYICDFHHNISVERSEYKPENVTHQVDQLFKKGLVADRFTVAIDCTVDFLRSEDVRNFLEVHKERITKGQLNLVLYRSAQKFDMLGMDNYYGGFTITINDSKSYNEFDKRMAQKEDQVKGLSHQGLAHLTEFGGEHLESYRQALMTNTRKLYDGLPANCKGDTTSPLMIAKTEDPNNVFLDIQFPALSELFALGNTMPAKGPKLNGFYNHFIQWAQAQNLAFTTRPSFGFATTNFTTIAGSKVRLNPGLESDESIKKYIAYFTKVHQLLDGAQKEALAKRPKTSFATEKEFTDFLDKISDEALSQWKVPKVEQVKPQSINKIEHPKGVGDGNVKKIVSLKG